MIHSSPLYRRSTRRGVLVPIVAVALVAVMGGIALVLDRMWIEMARQEMRIASEASALAAARQLVSDDFLRSNPHSDQRILRAKTAAQTVAAQNLVAGRPLILHAGTEGDIRLGRLMTNPGTNRISFTETSIDPRTVVILARRNQQRNNPIALLMNGISPAETADVVVTAEASIENRIIGIRPLPGSTAPVWPLAILSEAASNDTRETWSRQILQRLGPDHYSVNENTGAVQRLPDGIPEMTLTFAFESGNAVLLPFRSARPGQDLIRMISSGLSEQDLSICGGALIPDHSLVLDCSTEATGKIASTFRMHFGICRACLLFTSEAIQGQVRCPQMVAIRILECHTDSDGILQLTIQPGVMETRAAILADNGIASSSNPYIYHLSLTQ